MYPKFLKDAELENRVDAKVTFNYANKVEKVHAKLYQEAIEAGVWEGFTVYRLFCMLNMWIHG